MDRPELDNRVGWTERAVVLPILVLFLVPPLSVPLANWQADLPEFSLLYPPAFPYRSLLPVHMVLPRLFPARLLYRAVLWLAIAGPLLDWVLMVRGTAYSDVRVLPEPPCLVPELDPPVCEYSVVLHFELQVM